MEEKAPGLQFEIESKFLVNRFPTELAPTSVVKIEQTYIGVGKKDELRVRRLTNVYTGQVSHTFAFKKGSKEDRLEFDQPISQELYESVVANLNVKPLIKKRTTLGLGSYQVEIDEYLDYPFVVAEVEFPDATQMNAFIPPSWCSENVSDDKSYSNKNLWKNIQEKGA